MLQFVGLGESRLRQLAQGLKGRNVIAQASASFGLGYDIPAFQALAHMFVIWIVCNISVLALVQQVNLNDLLY